MILLEYSCALTADESEILVFANFWISTEKLWRIIICITCPKYKRKEKFTINNEYNNQTKESIKQPV